MLKDPGKNQFDPSKDVKVISSSVTFYPPDGNNEEGLTLLNSCAFISTNFNETPLSFTTENSQVVLQIDKNGVLFFISTTANYSIELLKYILQILKNTAIFLFGDNYANVMLKNIKQSSKDVFARFVVKIFEMINNDYKTLLNIYETEPTYYNFFTSLYNSNPLPNISDSSLITQMFLFCHNRLVWRAHRPNYGSCTLDDIFQICVLEKLEFEPYYEVNELDISLLNSETPNNPIHKGCNVHFTNLEDHSSRSGILSCVRFGQSPYVLLCLSLSSNGVSQELSNKLQQSIEDVRQKLIDLLKSAPQNVAPTTYIATGMIHYLIIDRTNGQSWELKHQNQSDGNTEEYQKNVQMFDTLERKMASLAMEAASKGYTTMIRNDLTFMYTYEIMLFHSKSKDLIPIKEINKKDGDIDYSIITHEKHVHVIELLTAYLGVLNSGDTLQINHEFLSQTMNTMFDHHSK